MTPYVQDPDFTLWHGDCLEVLRELPSESVDCCVTSPPYWGLRDYGTGTWEGGDPDCDHAVRKNISVASSTLGGGTKNCGHQQEGFHKTCGRCGATRVDQQIGLEDTPAAFVARMVEVFREVRRVLVPTGTCWINLGDSYASSPKGNPNALSPGLTNGGRHQAETSSHRTRSTVVDGLKPKDLVGIPWRVAFALQDDGWWLRSDIIWSKPNPMPESVTDRPTKAHEYVFLLTKQPRYYFDQDAVREPYQPSSIERDKYGYNHAYANQFRGSPTDRRFPDGKVLAPTIGNLPPEAERGPDGRRQTTVRSGDGSIQHRDGERWPNTGRNVRSVWEIATQPYAEAHFATFPQELPSRCIRAGCPENGVVLDPFMGSGTTALVARALGRRSIGIELNADYCQLAANRLSQQSLFA